MWLAHMVEGSHHVIEGRHHLLLLPLQYINVNPAPLEVLVNMSLWDSTQRLINAAKDIAGKCLPWRGRLLFHRCSL